MSSVGSSIKGSLLNSWYFVARATENSLLWERTVNLSAEQNEPCSIYHPKLLIAHDGTQVLLFRQMNEIKTRINI